MPWRPLVPEDQRAAIAAIVGEIVAAIEASPTSKDDPIALALARAYGAQADIVPDPDDASGAALTQAVNALVDAHALALHGGVAGTGWLVAHVATGEDADTLCEHVDRALSERLTDWVGDYDLIGGLVGFGVYALERGEPGRPLAVQVLDKLATRARPHRGGLGWHTAPFLLPAHQREVAPDGYWNVGLSHGVPGVIALLARYVAHDIAAPRAAELLEGAVTALLAAEPARPDGRFPGWYAGGPDGEGAAMNHENRRRLAWCYNDLGIAIALLAAAQATRNRTWRDEALALGRACAGRSIEQAAVLDAGLCHGASGAAHLFNRLWQATNDEGFARAAERWLARTLAMRTDLPLAGFPARAVMERAERWVPDPSLLNGAAGVALVLHSLITDVEPTWDRLILSDLALANE